MGSKLNLFTKLFVDKIVNRLCTKLTIETFFVRNVQRVQISLQVL